jgi:hypothetical protein
MLANVRTLDGPTRSTRRISGPTLKRMFYGKSPGERGEIVAGLVQLNPGYEDLSLAQLCRLAEVKHGIATAALGKSKTFDQVADHHDHHAGHHHHGNGGDPIPAPDDRNGLPVITIEPATKMPATKMPATKMPATKMPAAETSLEPEPAAKKVCSICAEEYEGFGNNAWPCNEGRCCDRCDAGVVTRTRFAAFRAGTAPTVTLGELLDEHDHHHGGAHGEEHGNGAPTNRPEQTREEARELAHVAFGALEKLKDLPAEVVWPGAWEAKLIRHDLKQALKRVKMLKASIASWCPDPDIDASASEPETVSETPDLVAAE